MKRTLILTAIILTISINLQAKPVAGITSISWNTTRGMTIASLIEQHAVRILKERSPLDTIDPGIINRELSKFSCFDERCVTAFARNAGINLVINGNVQDRDTYLNITLRAYGVNRIFNGKLIYSYTAEIPLNIPVGSREFSLISEEHTARFIAAALESFRQDIEIRKSGDTYVAATELKLNGRYTLYHKNSGGEITETGDVTLSDSRVAEISNDTIPADSFIILGYKKESSGIKKYYSSRKRDILFHKSSVSDTLYIALLTPFASASMPFASPFLGYYMNNDWQGLGLWMVNATPYIYMEARGLCNSPSRLREKKEDISKDDRAMYYFGWYMVAAGGLPLFIDSYANSYLKGASYYSGDTRLLGNNLTAAYLSLVSNGGGMFYRGHRGWGYFYFHLNNILLYTTLREFSRSEEYIPETGSYRKKDAERENAKKLCAALILSKLVETVHTLVCTEDIENGRVTEEYIIPEPFFSIDERNSPVYGISASYRF